MSYDVELDIYTGPLDLLLELIERQDLDICDVSLSKVTDGYLDHMSSETLSNADMNAFLSVAAQLIKIKARTVSGILEPNTEQDDKDENLVQKLQDYQQLKERAKVLKQLHTLSKQSFTTGSQATSNNYQHLSDRLSIGLQKLTLAKQTREQFQLRLARNQPQLAKHRQEFQQLLQTLKRVQLGELMSQCDSHDQQVVYFLCILESVRSQRLSLGYHNQAIFLEAV